MITFESEVCKNIHHYQPTPTTPPSHSQTLVYSVYKYIIMAESSEDEGGDSPGPVELANSSSSVATVAQPNIIAVDNQQVWYPYIDIKDVGVDISLAGSDRLNHASTQAQKA